MACDLSAFQSSIMWNVEVAFLLNQSCTYPLSLSLKGPIKFVT
ncbi:hypothetical protein F383_26168 [Gossypium arboreum]|uniref:Uncharacterized protein n=1 Tax=Gossypium arboreum TaxID=29729 RepID=A0A0B0P017_GOSAR|nr:hypothetical protein F383_26168 [Gossypium arboreum]